MNPKKKWLMLISIVLIAFCLRAPITGVGSILEILKADLGLSSNMAGMLTTIPLLAFGALSIIIGPLGKKLGAGKVMFAGLVALLVGILCRSYLGITGLFLGTIIVGVGIVIANVLLPALIKAYFPNQVSLMTSLYTTIMTGFAGLSAGISVPIAQKMGWQSALSIWGVLVGITIISWLPNLHTKLEQNSQNKSINQDGRGGSIIKSAMTWWITLYMGIQSLLFYCFVAWFATILQSKGCDAQVAGYYSSAYMILGIPGSILVPILARGKKNLSGLGVVMGLIYVIGMAIIVLSSRQALLLLAVILCGVASGACFTFVMALFGLRTKNAQDASALSGLAQSVGYLLAAVGPSLMGQLNDLTAHWTLPLIVLLLFTVLMTVLGYVIGRYKFINE